jgi:hypothetical protein
MYSTVRSAAKLVIMSFGVMLFIYFKLSFVHFSIGDGFVSGGQNGMSFSTKDSDNDLTSNDCAEVRVGAWW